MPPYLPPHYQRARQNAEDAWDKLTEAITKMEDDGYRFDYERLERMKSKALRCEREKTAAWNAWQRRITTRGEIS